MSDRKALSNFLAQCIDDCVNARHGHIPVRCQFCNRVWDGNDWKPTQGWQPAEIVGTCSLCGRLREAERKLWVVRADMKARADRRAGVTFGAPEPGEDVFKGFRGVTDADDK